jgi:hypothetical protein
MPDHIEPVVAEGLAEWPAMLHDLEKRVEVLSDALEAVKLSLRRIVMAEPWLEEAMVKNGAEAAPTPLRSISASVTQSQPDVPESAPAAPAAIYDEEAREAVRRAVQEAKSQMAGDEWRAETSSFVNEEKPDVSWITVPDDGSAPEPLPVIDDDMVAELIDHRDTAAAPAGVETEGHDGPAYTEPEGEEDPREAVRRAVEQAKAEMGFGTQQPAPLASPADDEEAAREAVRQAVAQARAELATDGWGPAAKPVEVAPKFVVPPPHRPERVHPPTITIEDPEGRVELARVYNLLKRLDCAANSSLLNYSSRQVSVQLSDNQPPQSYEVGDAVREVFERENDVSVDGLNVIVKLGDDYIQAA